MSKRAVVTGASGQLGFHVARAALQAGFEVELLVRRKNTNIERLLAAGAHFNIVNFNDRTSFRRHLEWADVLFQVSAPNERRTNETASSPGETLGPTEQILNAAVAAGVPRIVYTSSVLVLGRSLTPDRLIREQDRSSSVESPYVQTKVSAERFCDRLIRDHGIDLRRTYPSMLLGPGLVTSSDSGSLPVQQLLRAFLRNGQRFSFEGGISIGSVEEAGRAHVTAALASERCGTYVLGGENMTFQQFYTELSTLSGHPAPRLSIPNSLLFAGFTAPAAAVQLAGWFAWYDSSKAIEDLGYRIPPIRDVLASGILMERKKAAGVNALFSKPTGRQTATIVSVGEPQAPPVLLTGVPGWLGNRFVDVLLNGDRTGFRYPHRKVKLLVHPRHRGLFDLPENFEIFPIDYTRPQSLKEALKGVKTVFHLAEIRDTAHTGALDRVNTDATRNLINECIRAEVRRFLYLSTDAVCGSETGENRIFDENTPAHPEGDYGRSKKAAEDYVLENTRAGMLDGTILRGFWFFGPFAPARQERFLAAMRRRRQLVFGTGRNFQSVSHIDNMVAAFLAAERSVQSIGKAYWIGDQKADYTIDEIYSSLCAAFDVAYRPIYIPSWICSAARFLGPGTTRLKRLHSIFRSMGTSGADRAGTIAAAQRDFEYRPVISFPEYCKEIGKGSHAALASKKASAS